MATSKRQRVKLRSSKSHYCYSTTKNTLTTPDRLVLRKFDPIVREHVEFKETK